MVITDTAEGGYEMSPVGPSGIFGRSTLKAATARTSTGGGSAPRPAQQAKTGSDQH